MAQAASERSLARPEGGIRKVQSQALSLVKLCECRGLRVVAPPLGVNCPYDRVENTLCHQENPMPASAAAEKDQPATRFAKDQLKAIVERIERLEEEKKATSDDIRDVYAEAKGNGFDVKALRSIVSLRKQDTDERREQQAVLETYMHALGMLQ